MEEKAFKKILLKSKVRTSEGFTDDLMKRLETRKAERPTSIQIALRPAIWGLVIVGMAVLALFFLVPTTSFTVYNRIHLGKTPLMVGLIFLFILGINHMLRLSQKVESYNQLVKQQGMVLNCLTVVQKRIVYVLPLFGRPMVAKTHWGSYAEN